MNFLEAFLKYNQKHKLFAAGEKILIAVSGGIDSVVLLHLFLQIRQEWSLQTAVAHFNHHLRGDESDGDEIFVRNLCKKNNIDFFTGSEDVGAYSKAKKISIEMGARECRYDFFARVVREHQFDHIALGHNANDQGETILSHIIRGSGVRGLSGISPSREAYIRPLLFATRKEIKDYAQQQNLSFCEDSTNADISYQRNRIRHILMPAMARDFNPNIVKTLNRLGENMAQVDDYLQRQSKDAYLQCLKYRDNRKIVLDIIKFLAYFEVLQKYILEFVLIDLKKDFRVLDYGTFERIKTLVNKKQNKTFEIASDLWIIISGNELFIGQPEKPQEEIFIQEIPGQYQLWNNLIFEIKRVAKPLEQVLKMSGSSVEWIDEKCIKVPLKIRTYHHGDRFQPLNLGGSKKLSDFFIDEKIAVYRRNSIPILESKGRIVWVCGHRLDERFKITEKTSSVLKLELRKKY